MVQILKNAAKIKNRQDELLESGNKVLDFIASPISEQIYMGGRYMHVTR